MDNQGKLIREVARELGLNQKQVLKVVSSQTALARKALQNKETTSVYLRKVGTFMSLGVRLRLKDERIKRSINKVKTTKEAVEDEPLRF